MLASYACRFRPVMGLAGTLAAAFILTILSGCAAGWRAGGGTSWRNLALEVQATYGGLFDPDQKAGIFLLTLSYEVNSLVEFF